MENVVCSDQERAKIESFKRELRNKFDQSEHLRKLEAGRKGENYVPSTYTEPSEAECLATIRAGWKSQLDMRFERKFKRQGISK